jgi:poly-gamma-glutamate synthesis protein (capsule biosynthesis protein)
MSLGISAALLGVSPKPTFSLDDPRAVPGGAAQSAGAADRELTLFLAGDVMTGRGIDQILPRSVAPRLHEPYVKSADVYVRLAEEENGPIPEEVLHDYVWGDSLEELARLDPHARIINLETAVTTSDDWWRGKGIHYRMHPGNVPVLTAAGIDACALGNNHVLDWGYAGLRETLEALRDVGVQTAGAGADLEEAAAPATLQTPAGRLLVFSYGSSSAGVPEEWAAGPARPGVDLLPDLGRESARRVSEHIQAYRQEGDRVVVSLHWGGNWGYPVNARQREFAHRLIDADAADIVYGHSSHHPKGIEVYRGRPILYGCGDFLNDYEGIGGKERFRAELTLMYFPAIDHSGDLMRLDMTPMRVCRFRLQRASSEEASWLAATLDRESRKLGARVELDANGRLSLRWG